MRLHVSGVGAGISTTDLREKFSSAGRVLDVFRPEPRQLGTEVIRREFAFVEIADEDRDRAQKIVNVVRRLQKPESMLFNGSRYTRLCPNAATRERVERAQDQDYGSAA